MKSLSFYLMLILSFSSLFGMEIGEDELIEEQIEQDIKKDTSNNSSITRKPDSLSNLAAQFLAKKLMNDIRSGVETDSKAESYKEYLTSCQLTKEAQKLILKALAKNNPALLWKILPFDIAQHVMGINNTGITRDEAMTLKEIITLPDNKLLMIYEESNGRNSDKVSKIYIWDMETNDWFEVDFPLPKIHVFKSLISKDFKTLLLWCYGYFVLVYDLENKMEISRIISSPDVIKSFCLHNNDSWVCFGTSAGNVKIFDKETAEEVFSFKASTGQNIELIDAIDDSIVTVDPFYVQTWKLKENENEKLAADRIGSIFLKDFSATNLKLYSKGQKILIHFAYFTKHVLNNLTFSELKSLETHRIYPALRHDSVTRNHDGKIIFVREHCGPDINNRFRFLKFLDTETGKLFKKFDFDKIQSLDSNEKWESFAMSPDNDLIILYDKKGNIAKISLNFDLDLKTVLAQIKSELANPIELPIENSSSEMNNSRCLIA